MGKNVESSFTPGAIPDPLHTVPEQAFNLSMRGLFCNRAALGDDDVRAPIPAKRERLYEPVPELPAYLAARRGASQSQNYEIGAFQDEER